MIKEAIEKIENLSKPHIEEKDGVLYSDKILNKYVLGEKPNPDLIQTSTLDSIIDYVKDNDLDDSASYLIHVAEFNKVNVYGEFEKIGGKRRHFIQSNFNGFEFNFNNFMDREMLNIKLQTQFHSGEGRESLLSFIGNIKAEQIKSETDDGITQSATVKVGVVNVENRELPNPVKLSPKRTFPEIKMDETIYVVRGTQGGSGISFGIFEADGGLWKLNAIEKISKYLIENLGEVENIKIIA